MNSSTYSLSRRAVLRHAGRFAVAAPFLTVLGCSEDPLVGTRLSFSGLTMGTYYRVTIIRSRSMSEPHRIQTGVERVLETINWQLSTYRPESELSKINASPETVWLEVSPEVAHVVTKALEISRLSSGTFDATIAPLINLWGFGPDKQSVYSHKDKRITEALGKIGHHLLEVKEAPAAIRKSRPDLHVDLSGIGKGSAVDKVADHLARAGAEHFLVDIGGDMRARRASSIEATWRIGIERPSIGSSRTVHRVINVGDGALATSGNYRNFFKTAGFHYSHIIDPRTGAPVNHDLASVTVIAPTAEEADAWSTAFMVCGPDAGLELAERLGIPAFFIIRTKSGLVDQPSSEFRRFLIG